MSLGLYHVVAPSEARLKLVCMYQEKNFLIISRLIHLCLMKMVM